MAKLISQVYGEALFEAALETKSVDAVYEEAAALKEIWNENGNFVTFLNHPEVTREEKILLLQNVFTGRVCADTLGFLTTVVEKGRQGSIPAILDYYILKVKEYKKIGIAVVTSAAELTAGQKQEVEKRLLETTEYTSFEMHYTVDTSLIGGLMIRIGDRVVDSSIKTRLYDLKKELMEVQLG